MGFSPPQRLGRNRIGWRKTDRQRRQRARLAACVVRHKLGRNNKIRNPAQHCLEASLQHQPREMPASANMAAGAERQMIACIPVKNAFVLIGKLGRIVVRSAAEQGDNIAWLQVAAVEFRGFFYCPSQQLYRRCVQRDTISPGASSASESDPGSDAPAPAPDRAEGA